MTPEELAAIRARAEAATPGPWDGVPGRCILPDDWNHRYTAHQVIEGCIYNPNAENDHAFIAHAREDIPALVAEVERLQAELAAARARIAALENQLDELGEGAYRAAAERDNHYVPQLHEWKDRAERAEAELARVRPVVEAAEAFVRATRGLFGGTVDVFSPDVAKRTWERVHEALVALDAAREEAHGDA